MMKTIIKNKNKNKILPFIRKLIWRFFYHFNYVILKNDTHPHFSTLEKRYMEFVYEPEKTERRLQTIEQISTTSCNDVSLSLMMKIIVKKKILYWLQQFLLRFHYEIKRTNKNRDTIWQKSSICQIENKFLLLLTPPNSGSTAISHFICQSNKVYSLVQSGEGLRLLYNIWIREVCTHHSYINYKSLAGMLAPKINKLEQAYPEMEYIFDKTPDSACRYKSLLKIIPNTKVVANNRNPYAHIASALKRKYIPLRCPNPHDPLEECRVCIHYWLVWSEYIRDACEKDNVSLVTYEQFCDNPHTLISAFSLEESEFKKDFHVSHVKDYAPQAIENMNEKQIALLSDLEKETITEALSEHKELLAYFGYELMS